MKHLILYENFITDLFKKKPKEESLEIDITKLFESYDYSLYDIREKRDKAMLSIFKYLESKIKNQYIELYDKDDKVIQSMFHVYRIEISNTNDDSILIVNNEDLSDQNWFEIFQTDRSMVSRTTVFKIRILEDYEITANKYNI